MARLDLTWSDSSMSQHAARSLVRLPLARRPKLLSNDLAEVHRHMEAVIHPHELGLDESATISFCHNQAKLGALSLNAISYGQSNGRIRIRVPPMQDHYMVQLSLAGSTRVAERGGSFDIVAGQVFVIRPEEEHEQFLSPGYRHLNVTLPRRVMERLLLTECGVAPSGPIRFKPVSIRDNPVRSLWQLIWTICQDLDRDAGILSHPRVGRSIEDTLVRTILASVPHNYSDRFNTALSPAAPFYVRRAEEYIRLNLCDELTLDDIVVAAGVSTRTLQAGFRSYRETTPLAYLKARRLERANALLAEAHRSGRSVTDVAFSCGFSHLSKFARDYALRFGENPSSTRNKGRPS
jgi:AraC-like DNA-binding protein